MLGTSGHLRRWHDFLCRSWRGAALGREPDFAVEPAPVVLADVTVARIQILLSALVLIAACGERAPLPSASAPEDRTSERSVHVTMDALHATGGVPPGWQLTMRTGDVAAGRRTFADLGCPSCHAVTGESFSDRTPSGPGPDLTGMGRHHPPAYFVEAIVNPDAVVVSGPGWSSPQGRSTMPAYPDLTVTQIEDLVAYLTSLETGGLHAGHVLMPAVGAAGASPSSERPSPPVTAARAFFAQSYDVLPGRLAAFEEWFRREGAQRWLAAVDGLLGIETFVDTTRERAVVTTVWSFRDEAALIAFVNTPDAASFAIGTDFDAFVGPHDHALSRTPPVYRAPGLSTP